MITGKITNIVLDKTRIRVFIVLDNGVEECNIFTPEATSEDIKNYLVERINYYNDLESRVEELRSELVEE